LQVGKGSSFTFDLALADEDCDSESEGDSFSEVDRSAAARRHYNCTASSSHAAYADFVFSLCFILKQDNLMTPEGAGPTCLLPNCCCCCCCCCCCAHLMLSERQVELLYLAVDLLV
jgi:hypothetical protein